VSVAQEKENLRQNLLSALQNLPKNEREQAGEKIASHLRPWLLIKSGEFAKGVALFTSLKTEVDTRPIDHLLQQLAFRRFLPNYDKQHPDLWFYELPEGRTLPSKSSDGYPNRAADHLYAEHISLSEIALVIVPALAFDERGNRLGRGKGYYDRFLAKLAVESPHSTTMVIGLDLQLLSKVPVEAHDQRLEWYCTPKSGVRAVTV
jgi:5-formyltetrahydrofolate cyclo-ligase